MIITEEHDVLELQSGGLLQKQDVDGPPPYSVSGISIPPGLQASNFLSISRKLDIIKGRYLIDLAHRVPPVLLPAQNRETSNLRIRNFGAGIDASVWLVNSEPESVTDVGVDGKRAVLDVNSTFGPVRLSLYADSARTPFALSVRTSFGPIALSIPRTFRGPLTIQSGVAPIKLSPSLAARFQTLEEANGKRTGFVGDWRASAEEGRTGYVQDGRSVEDEQWKGSTIEVGTAYGPIRISFVEDNSEA